MKNVYDIIQNDIIIKIQNKIWDETSEDLQNKLYTHLIHKMSGVLYTQVFNNVKNRTKHSIRVLSCE